ncbi:DEDD exonuclease domain-containing protein [Devriesea agamarum]|uniref:DEDD exonuclease domain-containing protein n=1 Tax=Devriesea agamarum TaxID=472569 RepID=UPI000A0038FA|nr:DEDD exonuclease domain-containing protein [Devriesea agamarum]
MSTSQQLTIDDLGHPLQDVDFVVVDLETTGSNAQSDSITEIGAVRTVGGEVRGEFRTFVHPEQPIPAFIATLTGITNAMVQDAPPARVAVSMFLEFARGSVLVAHNARFDIGFLRAHAERAGIPWPGQPVIDTLRLARSEYQRDEVRNHRLATLAAYVGATTTPDHRALADARATVDVLHHLIARLSARGITTLEGLRLAHNRPTPVQEAKRALAEGLPSSPGVYRFLDSQGKALYIGKSLDVKSRVRTYFTPSERRRPVLDMLPRAVRVDVIPCSTEIEAAVRELRAIAADRPCANRQSVRQRSAWLRLGPRPGTSLTSRQPSETGLRLALIARDESDGSAHIGPLRSRHDVEPLRALLLDAVGGRGTSLECPQSPGDSHTSTQGQGFPLEHHDALRRIMVDDPTPVIEMIRPRMMALAEQSRYEDAAAVRDRALMYLHAARRACRLRELAQCQLLIAARPAGTEVRDRKNSGRIGAAARRSLPDWELLAVRYGRLSGSVVIARHADPLAAAHALASTGQGEAEHASPLCQGYHQEAELLLRWLEAPGVRVVKVDGLWGSAPRARFDESVLVAGALSEGDGEGAVSHLNAPTR